jgi:O-antigen/teichoic acid export membrane protein
VARKSARGSFYLFVGSLVSELINAAGAVLVARLLTPEEYGVYHLSFILPGIFVMFSGLGTRSALTRFLARYQAEDKRGEMRGMVRIGLLFNGGLSILLSAVLYLSSDVLASVALVRPGLGGNVRIASIITFLLALHSTVSAIFFGLERMEYMAAIVVLNSVVRTIIGPFLVIRGFGAVGALMGYSISYVVSGIASVVLILRELSVGGSSPNEGEASLGKMLRFGFPLYLGGLVNGIGLRYQGLLQAWFATDLAIGNLSIATKFKSLVGLFTVPIASTIYPAFSKYSYRERPREMTSMFKTSIRYATILVIPMAALVMILAKPAVVTLFGVEYTAAPFFLVLAMLEFLRVGLGSLSVLSFLNSQGDTRTTLRLNLMSVGLMVVICTPLTWRLGVPGLLTGIALSQILSSGYNLLMIRGHYGLSIDLDHMLRVALFSGVAAAVTYLVMSRIAFPHSLLHLSAGSLIFLAACMFLAPLAGALNLGDLETVRKILRRGFVVYPLIAPFLDLEERIVTAYTGETDKSPP